MPRCLLWLFLVLCLRAAIALPVLTLGNSGEQVPLWGHMSVWEDPQGRADITTVNALPDSVFRPVNHPFSAGYTKSTFWFRFSAQRNNTAVRHWLLDVQPMYLDDLRLYSSSGDGTLREQLSGDHLPFARRAHPYRGFLFDVPLDNDAPRVFHLRLRTNSTSLALPVLMTPNGFVAALQKEALWQGAFFGLLFVMLLHTIAYWRWFREHFYLTFIGQLLALMVMGLGYGGFASQYLLPNNPEIADLLTPLGNCLYCIFSLTFFILFLKIRENSPRLYRLWQFSILIAIATLISLFYGCYVSMAPWLTIIFLATIPLCIYQSWRAYRDHSIGSLSLLAGSLVYAIVSSGNLLAVLGVVPAERMLVYGWQANAALFMLFMQNAVLSRLKHYQAKHAEARQRAYVAESAHRAEVERRQRQSQLLSLMSHELKTPLAVIDSAAQVLEYRRDINDRQSAIRHERIRRAVRQLNRLMEHTLNQGRHEDSGLVPRLERIALHDLLNEVIATVDDPQQRFVIGSLANRELNCDPTLMRVVVSNLLGNALEYSDPGTPIHLSATPSQTGALLELVVTSESRHVPHDLPARAFDRHWRGANSQGKSGMGLGLYLVKTITQSHGGYCTCRVEGHHVFFTVTIPVMEPKNRRTD